MFKNNIKLFLFTTLFNALVSILFFSIVYAGNDTELRRVIITVNDNGYFAGDTPLFLSRYNSEGEGGMGLSANWYNAELDITALKTFKLGPLGFQADKFWGNNLASVSGDTHTILFVDKNGLVFPAESRKVQKNGPFVRITLYQNEGSNREKVDANLFKMSFKNLSGDEYKYGITNEGKVVIQNVNKKPIRLQFISKKSGKKIDLKLFPLILGASPTVINYDVYNVNP